jgi:hypothetical protein
VPVLNECVTHEIELRRLTIAFPVKFCLWVSGARMRVVGAGFAVEIALTIAAW